MFLSLSLLWKVCGTSHLPTTANNVPELFAYVTATSHGLSLCPSLTFIWKLSPSLSLSLSLSLSFTHNLPIYSNSFSNAQTDSQTDQYLRFFETEQPNFVRSKNWTILPLPTFTSNSLSLSLSLSHT